MEWVETTGKTVAEALEAALDQLGVAASDAEVEVLEEPRNAIFGLRRSGARIRVRVRPVQARAKRSSRRPASSASGDTRSQHRPSRSASAERTRAGSGQVRHGGDRDAAQVERRAGERSRPRSRRGGSAGSDPAVVEEERPARAAVAPKEEEMSIETQAELAESFVRGVVSGFSVNATVESSIDDDVIHVRVVGDGLGLLVGPRGVTVDALQELTRTAVQHRADEHGGRIHVDVAGYRARRAAALQDFARRVAGEVVTSGQPQALEPMSAADRKSVHDAVSEIGGVVTSSEGEDPRRYVVIRPAGGSPDGDGDAFA